ncbi:MAG: DUF6240 domain-containing protein [Defluviitaleaceae bacterium]|nr:DUF6240 domain-containing protein [Defluviitaleaceae bacterium]
MTNTNIPALNPRGTAATPRIFNNSRNPLNFTQDANGLISAVIQQKNTQGTTLSMADGQSFIVTISNGEIVGNEGDTVFFQQTGENALKQVFPAANGQNILGKQLSLQSVQELMKHSDFVRPEQGALNISAELEARLEARQAAATAANRLARNIGRISGNVHSAAIAQLAAEGINIDKISVPLLDGVVSQLSEAKTNHKKNISKEITQKISDAAGLDTDQITHLLANQADITLDNLYQYKKATNHEMHEKHQKMAEADWQALQKDVERFLHDHVIEKTTKNLGRIRQLLDNGIPLTRDNFDKLVFLQDIEGNVDMPALLEKAIEMEHAGENLGKLDIYKETLFKAETRLAMSYAAAQTHTNLEIDLDPQIEAVKALKQLAPAETPTEQAVQKTAEAIKTTHALPQMPFAYYAEIAQNPATFTLSAIDQHITTNKYDQNATTASLKYGDSFAKIAEQFAPMLHSMGFADDDYAIRAAKILTAINMDINAENLAKIKDMDAKITDIQAKLHPRMAAQMVMEGLNPANMHIDDVLTYINKHTEQYGTSDHDQLLENIVKLDKQGDVDPAARRQMMDIYKMLLKITQNSGAGIGYAINAGVDLTLENLLNFAENFDAGKAKNNTINYAAEDGVYFAKHAVSSFIAAAYPAPLAALVKNEPLTDPLPKSTKKLENLAIEEGLDMEKINQAIKELGQTGKDALRTLTSMGIPVTLTNLRQLKATKDKQLEQEINTLDADEQAEILQILPTPDKITSNATQHLMADKLEAIMETADTPEKITKIDVILKNLNFRQMLNNSGVDFSFPIRFNGRMADVKLHLLSSNTDLATGVNVYLSLNTALGEVEGFVKFQGEKAEVSISAAGDGLNFLKANRDMLTGILADLGITQVHIIFLDKNYFKNQLSRTNNLPKY